MDFSLRQGESFTRWWTPQGGRWNHLPRYSREKWVRDLILTPPVGMKPNHRDFTRWNHGNGLFHYAPNLSAKSTDFQDGAYAVRNLTPGEQGLHLIHAGDAEVVFEVFTPYIIVAKINDLDNPADDAEASVVTLEAALPVKLAVSLDHGLTWQPVETVPSGRKAVDLTSLVKGTYGYLLRLSASGDERAGGHQVIVHRHVGPGGADQPASIETRREPSPVRGRATAMASGRSPCWSTPIRPIRRTWRSTLWPCRETTIPSGTRPASWATTTLRLAAPAGMKIAWLSVGATFRTHQGEQAAKTDNRIAYAVGEPRDFKEVYRSHVPTWVSHWRYNWDTDIRLDQPAEVVYVKFHGDPGLNTMRACLHLLPADPPSTAVQITHTYDIDGRRYEKTVDLAEPGGLHRLL